MSVDERSWMSRAQYAMTNRKQPIIVFWIIAINAVIFLAGFFGGRPGLGNTLEMLGYFSVDSAISHGEIWRFVTYQFLHANLGHIALNMIGLWVFGQVVESECGHVKFLAYYLICGIAAALFYSLLGSLGFLHPSISLPMGLGNIPENHIWEITPLIGASGSIYGVIAACAVLHPHARIQLIIPPVNLSVRNFAIGILCVSAAFIIFNWHNAGGEAGHMGGMVAGFLIMFTLQAKRYFFKRSRRLHNTSSMDRADAILDKVSASGFDSLTEEEWRILREASRHPSQNRKPGQR